MYDMSMQVKHDYVILYVLSVALGNVLKFYEIKQVSPCRPESKYGCYVTGFVQNSEIKWTNSKVGSCEGGTFKGGHWNNVTLHVRDNQLIVYLDGKHILSTDFHFQSR